MAFIITILLSIVFVLLFVVLSYLGSKMLKDLSALIIKHTVVSRRHLTPELAIRVIDSTCLLWTANEDQSPFKDPFWAFYWPGGQATARSWKNDHISQFCQCRFFQDLGRREEEQVEYCTRDAGNRFKVRKKNLKEELTPNIKNTILNHCELRLASSTSRSYGDGLGEHIELLDDSFGVQGADVVVYGVGSGVGLGEVLRGYILDNENIVKNRCVLDVGCGCGAGSIAAVKMKANRVVANDIDPYATTATQINAIHNKVKVEVSTDNCIGSKCGDFDTILIGDMFYDAEFAIMLFDWLQRLSVDGKTVILGDPGRHGLTDKMRQHITLLAKYELPKESCIENHGFTDACVWRIK